MSTLETLNALGTPVTYIGFCLLDIQALGRTALGHLWLHITESPELSDIPQHQVAPGP